MLVDRRGQVQHVMVGDAHSIIELPDWGRLRAGRGRLRGLRCIHTHLATRPDARRHDRPRAAAPRRHGDDRRRRGRPARPGAHGRAQRRQRRTAARRGAPLPCRRPQIDLDFSAWIRDLERSWPARPRPARSATASARSSSSVTAGRGRGSSRPRGRAARAGARRPVSTWSTWSRSAPARRSADGARRGKLAELVIRAFQQRRRPRHLRPGPDAHPGAQPRGAPRSCA